MDNAKGYGAHGFVIEESENTVYLYADYLEVQPSGALVAWGGYRKEGDKFPAQQMQIYASAPGQWVSFNLARK